ncbi:hypothetical protein DSL92_03305 [Billgrantia gudaonensis]|uniref:Uncharacterized protein n=1 Tax=Billgrantia gudaonensis TaxID=376427 RepID=A0A3S0NF14_9GAMM|nr:hypothetical protein DSL92_03305 [Halomonas gudaonensis]
MLGAVLIASWLHPSLTLWDEIDDAVFFLTNAWLQDANTLWVHLVAITNPGHSTQPACWCCWPFRVGVRRGPYPDHRLLRWGGVSMTMLIAAVAITPRD